MNRTVLAVGIAGMASLLSGAAMAATELSMWYHGAGNPIERKIITGIIDDFNKAQSDWTVKLEEFPQAAYNDSVKAAALAHKLPDILDIDRPHMPYYASSCLLRPLTRPARM